MIRKKKKKCSRRLFSIIKFFNQRCVFLIFRDFIYSHKVEKHCERQFPRIITAERFASESDRVKRFGICFTAIKIIPRFPNSVC